MGATADLTENGEVRSCLWFRRLRGQPTYQSPQSASGSAMNLQPIGNGNV